MMERIVQEEKEDRRLGEEKEELQMEGETGRGLEQRRGSKAEC